MSNVLLYVLQINLTFWWENYNNNILLEISSYKLNHIKNRALKLIIITVINSLRKYVKYSYGIKRIIFKEVFNAIYVHVCF